MAADPALVAYQALAAVYNDFNAGNDYEMWLGGVLIPELRKYGLREGGKALDVGCGSGRAFAPLLSRGWSVHGLDLSPAMLELAAQEGGAAVPLQVADMRELPQLGRFDLVLSLNDSVNYLLGDNDLVDALAGMRANLAPEGLIIFDVSSWSTYERGYSEEREVEHLGSQWVWTGRGEIEPSIFEARIEGDRLEPIRHLERFRSESEVLEAMREAGIHVKCARPGRFPSLSPLLQLARLSIPAATCLSRGVPHRRLLDVTERWLPLRVRVLVHVNQIENRFALSVYQVLPGLGTLLLVRSILLSEYRALWTEAEAARLKTKRDAAS